MYKRALVARTGKAQLDHRWLPFARHASHGTMDSIEAPILERLRHRAAEHLLRR